MGGRALVTGASGFVGANLARKLLSDGHDVHLLLRPNHDPWRVGEIRHEVTVHQAALDDRGDLDRVMSAARPEWIFHLAAYGAYPGQRDFERMVVTNLIGTANLLAAAENAGFDAFINAGSSSEYGYKDHAPSEDELVEPNSPYAVSKASATLFCGMTAQRTGLRIVTMRIYSAYGPYEEPTRLVPTLIVQGLDGRLPPLVNPEIARDYVHVDDVCDAFVLAAATPDQESGVVYNVGTGQQTSLGQIVEVSSRLLDVMAEPVWGSMPGRSWDTDVWISNPARIKAALGWSPRHDLESGLTQTIEWFRSNPVHLDRYRAAQPHETESRGLK